MRTKRDIVIPLKEGVLQTGEGMSWDNLEFDLELSVLDSDLLDDVQPNPGRDKRETERTKEQK